MERFPSSTLLTTSQVADLLAVHPSTVKRWCNEGDLEVDKTGGGHRRIHLKDVLALARSREITTFLEGFGADEEPVWAAVRRIADEGEYDLFHDLALTWLGRGDVLRLGRLVHRVGGYPGLAFDRFCDEGVRGLMAAIGAAWRSGTFCAGEEHMASEAVAEALLGLSDRTSVGRSTDATHENGAPVALVGGMEGDRHRLGCLCVRLLLERRGWRVYYLGADVPLEDYAALQRARGASLVCISFSPPRTVADMRRCLRLLTGLYDPAHPYALALGGDLGEVLEPSGMELPFRELGLHDRLTSFRAALDRGFGTRARIPRA